MVLHVPTSAAVGFRTPSAVWVDMRAHVTMPEKPSVGNICHLFWWCGWRHWQNMDGTLLYTEASHGVLFFKTHNAHPVHDLPCVSLCHVNVPSNTTQKAQKPYPKPPQSCPKPPRFPSLQPRAKARTP